MEREIFLREADGLDVMNWFTSGAQEVASHMRYLNAINVFPVADGDTGTNLSSTLRAMVERPAKMRSFARMLEGMSASALESARGNSGIIFASYINGIAIEARQYEAVGIKEFSDIAYGAVKHLYEAVEHPQEGTLMSVIRDWATFLSHTHEKYPGFQELFAAAYQSAAASLEKTRMQLEVLRKRNVVDSGAAGFVRFLQGVNRTFSKETPHAEEDGTPEPAPADPDEKNAGFRYCTEALVDVTGGTDRAEAALPGAVRRALGEYGDSLIVTSQSGRLKVHIHTNQPERVMERLGAFGRLIEQKADDMHLQNGLQAADKGGIGLLTDSIADLPDEYKLANRISTLPMGVLVGGEAYLDKYTIGLERLFREMDKPEDYPTSAQPEPGRIQKMLGELLERFDSLIVLSVASGLSGTWQAVTQAAKRMDPTGERITVIDTKLNSGAEGLLVKKAAELIAGGLRHGEVVAAVEALIPRTKIYVCLNTLRYAARGGRVPDTVGKIGRMLGLRPIMTLDRRGHGAAFGVAFSQAGLTRKILRIVRNAARRGGVEAYSIVHGGNLPLAMTYREQLSRITGLEPEFVSEISSVVALHAGPGTVAVCLTLGKEG